METFSSSYQTGRVFLHSNCKLNGPVNKFDNFVLQLEQSKVHNKLLKIIKKSFYRTTKQQAQPIEPPGRNMDINLTRMGYDQL